MKKQKGITLVSLVVTIIVLIILAGVTVSTIIGDSGIVNRALNSKNETEIAQYIERINFAINVAKVNAINSNKTVIEEIKTSLQKDELFAEAVIGTIENDRFLLETKEGYVFTVTEESVILNEETRDGGVELTLKHFDINGNELQATNISKYKLNEYVTVSSLNIDGYETHSIEIVANETNLLNTEGAPVKMSFPIYKDTIVTITYKECELTLDPDDNEQSNAGENLNNNYAEPAPIKQSSVAMNSTAMKEDSTIVKELQTTIESEDDYYVMDVEPIEGSGPLTITFDLSDKAVDGDIATVYHHKNNAWEKLGEYIVENLEIVITIDSFSPFYISILSADGVANRITSANDGDKIEYSYGGVSDWRVLYNDGNNVFIITSDYLNINNLPSGTGMATKGSYIAYWSNIPELQTLDSQQLNLFRIGKKGYTLNNINNNSKCVSTLLKTSNWSKFVNPKIATYAIGAPTIEMWMQSWNEKYPNEKLEYGTNANGYLVATEGGILDTNVPIATMQATTGYKTAKTNLSITGTYGNMYYPHPSDKAATYYSSFGYLLASPSGMSAGNIMDIGCDGLVNGRNGATQSYYSLRPVVCLNSDVILTKSNGIWKINQQ